MVHLSANFEHTLKPGGEGWKFWFDGGILADADG
jgi:hypothetical protein